MRMGNLGKTGLVLAIVLLCLSYAGVAAANNDSLNKNADYSLINSKSAAADTMQSDFMPESNIGNDTPNYPQAASQVEPVQKQSLIEKSFGVENLQQIGYDIFKNMPPNGSGAFNNNYRLNIGEKVKVYLWGDSVDMLSLTGNSALNPVAELQVDTGGNLFVQGVGLVKADGKSISEVEANIQSLLKQKYSSAKVKISVVNSAEIPVNVYGFVAKPGMVEIGANSTIIEALSAAGGVDKNGSLRNIIYKSDGKSTIVDLYDIILKGKNIKIKFRQGDSIFVKPVGNVACLFNGVKIPGIYEVKPEDNLNTLVSFAGGFLPDTDTITANIKSFSKASKQRISKDVPNILFNKTNILNGDIIEFKNLYANAENTVELTGNVKRPAIFQYKKGMKLSDILSGRDDLLSETFAHQAVIKRISGVDKQIISVPVSLEDLFNGGVDPTLQPGDVITVYKSTNIDTIDVFGSINCPKSIPYRDSLTLKDVIAGVEFMSAAVEQNENEIFTDTDSEQGIEKVSDIKKLRTKNDNIVYSPSDIAVEITNSVSGQSQIYYLYDVLIKNDAASSVKIKQNDRIFFRPLRDSEFVKTVKISGYVNNPGVYNFVKGERLSEIIDTAGGLTEDAYLRGIVFTRTNLISGNSQIMQYINNRDKKALEGQISGNQGYAQDDIDPGKLLTKSAERETVGNKTAGRIALDIQDNNYKKLNALQNIEVQDGDEIYIPRISNHVTVLGEVENESSFAYIPGKNAAYYIKYVGGYTSNARKSGVYKIAANGRAYRLGWLKHNSIDAGDTIVVPRKLNNNWLEVLKTTVQLGFNTLNAVFLITKI